MLFIDDDQAEVRAGREDRRTRADDDPRAPIANLVPLVVPLAFAEVRVEHGDLVLRRCEARFETFDGLRRERDFRHEHDRRLAAFEDELNGLEVNFRLATAGHAVEEDGLGLAGKGRR